MPAHTFGPNVTIKQLDRLASKLEHKIQHLVSQTTHRDGCTPRTLVLTDSVHPIAALAPLEYLLNHPQMLRHIPIPIRQCMQGPFLVAYRYAAFPTLKQTMCNYHSIALMPIALLRHIAAASCTCRTRSVKTTLPDPTQNNLRHTCTLDMSILPTPALTLLAGIGGTKFRPAHNIHQWDMNIIQDILASYERTIETWMGGVTRANNLDPLLLEPFKNSILAPARAILTSCTPDMCQLKSHHTLPTMEIQDRLALRLFHNRYC